MTNKIDTADLFLFTSFAMCFLAGLIGVISIGMGFVFWGDLMSGIGLIVIAIFIMGLVSSIAAAFFIIEHTHARQGE